MSFRLSCLWVSALFLSSADLVRAADPAPGCANFDLSEENTLLNLKPGTSNEILTVFSDDRSRLTVMDSKGATSFDVKSGQSRKLELGNIYLTQSSPDGKMLSFFDPRKKETIVWDLVKDKKSRTKSSGKTGSIRKVIASSIDIRKTAEGLQVGKFQIKLAPGAEPQWVVNPSGQTVAVTTGKDVQLIDIGTGKVQSVRTGARDIEAMEFFDDHRILLQTGTQLKVITPASFCVPRMRVSTAKDCAECLAGYSDISDVRDIEAVHRNGLCDSEYVRSRWAKESTLPGEGSFTAEQLKRMLLELAKPGAFLPEKHLPALVAAFDAGIQNSEPDLTLHALAGIFTTDPEVYEQLTDQYTSLGGLKPKGLKACRSEKENGRVQKALETYIRNSDLIALGREVDPKRRSSQPAPRFVLTVGSDLKEHQTGEWAAKKCQMIHEKVQLATDQPVDTACAAENVDQKLAQTVEQKKLSGRYGYLLGYHELKDGTLSYEVADWKQKYEKPLGQGVKFTLLDPSKDEQITHKLVKQVVTFDRNRRAVQELALLNGLKLSKRLTINAETGEYFDRQTSKKLDFENAYKLFEQEDPKQKNYLLGASEIALILGASMADYYTLSAEINKVDWQFGFWEGMRKKLIGTEGMRFDDNRSSLNIGHALAGTGYYIPCRTNNLSAMESFGCALIASYFWETFGEFREIWSINDMITTPVGGLAIGEPLYQNGKFFSRGSGGMLNSFGKAIFGGPQAINNWFNGIKSKPAEEVDEFGFPTDVWHQFSISAGYGTQSRSDKKGSEGTASVGFETQILNQSTYDKAGKADEIFKDTMYSKIKGRLSVGQMTDLEVMTKTVLAGYYKQDTKLDEKGKLSGYSFLIGPSTGVDLRQQKVKGGAEDMVATVNVLGSTIDVTGYKNGVRMRATLDVYGDFAMVRSYAIDDYARDSGREGLPSVLKLNDYYHAGGATVAASGSVSYKNLELSAEFKKQYLKGIDGSDRFQESIARPIKKTDELTSAKLAAALKLTNHIRVKTSAELLERRSNLDKYSKDVKTKRYLGELEFLF